MKQRSDSSFRIMIPRWFPLYLALLFLLIPIRLLLAIMISASLHECSHLLAIRLCRINIQAISVGILGARIKTGPMETWQELICSAAGPLGSLLVVLFIRFVPLISVCSIFHAIFNLLPIGSMDGARVLRCVLQMTKYN